MKLWSKGLGRTEIDMDFRRYVVTNDRESANVRVCGRIVDPVKWEFRITVTPEDVPGMIRLALSRAMLKLVALNLYRYIQYLFARREYAPENPQALLSSVDTAYDTMMQGTSSRRKRRPSLIQPAAADHGARAAIHSGDR